MYIYKYRMSKPEIYKAKDICDNFVVKKNIIPSIPFRMLLVGRSGSGKSNILSCMVALDSWYNKDFEGDNIYIWTGSPGDQKMQNLIEFKDIPESNVFNSWRESEVSEIYDEMVSDWKQAIEEKKRPHNTLFIIDDLFFSNQFRSENVKNSMLNKIFQNSRKYNGNVIILAQKYSSIATPIRENANCLIAFSATNKQIDLIKSDFDYLENRNLFEKIYKKATEDRHSFIFINIENPIKDRYLDSNFNRLLKEDEK
tara:strand:+ start:127 stop:891 length:765 start_codon:yes stop_codon:yes gene_type:complete